MKLKFLIFETKAPSWVEEGRLEYAAKLKPFAPFEIRSLKSPVADRDSADVKRRLEAKILLEEIGDKDLLILFDEKGKKFPSSEDFAKHLARVLESGKTNAAFCIGGPYGFADEVVKRAEFRWSLSDLTFNHWIAQLTALEQIYRGFTLCKNIPYHNR
jgi:23S rRNA (pseudouridine1915-N3)-methyltransferase